jgi:hypothetical protein
MHTCTRKKKEEEEEKEEENICDQHKGCGQNEMTTM